MVMTPHVFPCLCEEYTAAPRLMEDDHVGRFASTGYSILPD